MRGHVLRAVRVLVPLGIVVALALLSPPRAFRTPQNLSLALSAAKVKSMMQLGLDTYRRPAPAAAPQQEANKGPKKDKNYTPIKNRGNSKVKGSKGTKTKQWPVTLPLTNGSIYDTLDLEQYSKEEQTILRGRLGVMRERAERVWAACQNAPAEAWVTEHGNYVWDTSHSPNIVFCPNYKVASTTWMMNFLRLVHFNDDNPDIPDVSPEKKEKLKFSVKFGATHSEVFRRFPMPKALPERIKVFNHSARVIIVRHPYSRLLSAYRDKMTKLAPGPPRFNFRQMQLKIIKKYRKPEDNTDSVFPTFAEFAQYVIDSSRTLRTAKEWKEKVKCWLPYWAQCGVCAQDYNVIMKLETEKEDEQFLATMSDLKEIKHLQVNHTMHLHGQSSTDIAPEYYRQLTTKQMLDLYQTYKLDFDLFGYNIDYFLKIAKDFDEKR